MDDVGVADVDDPHLVHRQVDRIVLVVVGAAMAEREERGRLADAARPEARTGAVLRAHVERHAEHRDIGIERVPVEARRAFAERAVPDKRKIETTLLIGMHSTLPTGPTLKTARTFLLVG